MGGQKALFMKAASERIFAFGFPGSWVLLGKSKWPLI